MVGTQEQESLYCVVSTIPGKIEGGQRDIKVARGHLHVVDLDSIPST